MFSLTGFDICTYLWYHAIHIVYISTPSKVFLCTYIYGGSDSKEYACSERDLGLIPGLGRSPEEGNGYPLWYPSWRIPRTEEPVWQ